jgi:hypothetical protein
VFRHESSEEHAFFRPGIHITVNAAHVDISVSWNDIYNLLGDSLGNFVIEMVRAAKICGELFEYLPFGLAVAAWFSDLANMSNSAFAIRNRTFAFEQQRRRQNYVRKLCCQVMVMIHDHDEHFLKVLMNYVQVGQ